MDNFERIDSRTGSRSNESRTATGYPHLDLLPAGPALGAFVRGLDLSRSLEPAVVDELARAHADYGVLFFRDQQLSEEAHIALAQQFGDINVNRFFAGGPRPSADRRGEKGAGPTAEHRWRLAHGPQLRSGSGPRLPPVCAGRSLRQAATPCLPACTPPTKPCPKVCSSCSRV